MTKPAWKIIVSETALKQLSKLDKTIQVQINTFLQKKVLSVNNPRLFGKSLSGNLEDFWSYRVGDYRILTKIEDHIMTVMVIKIAHRKEVYRDHH